MIIEFINTNTGKKERKLSKLFNELLKISTHVIYDAHEDRLIVGKMGKLAPFVFEHMALFGTTDKLNYLGEL